MESIAGVPRRYHAIAERETTALALEADALMDVFEDKFAMAMDFLGGIAQRILDVVERAGSDRALLELLTDTRTPI